MSETDAGGGVLRVGIAPYEEMKEQVEQYLTRKAQQDLILALREKEFVEAARAVDQEAVEGGRQVRGQGDEPGPARDLADRVPRRLGDRFADTRFEHLPSRPRAPRWTHRCGLDRRTARRMR